MDPPPPTQFRTKRPLDAGLRVLSFVFWSVFCLGLAGAMIWLVIMSVLGSD